MLPKRSGLLCVSLSLVILAFALAGCEKERPAPKASATALPSGTAAAGATARSTSPVVVLPSTKVTQAAPAPLGPSAPATPLPPTPAPLAGSSAPAPAPAAPRTDRYFVYAVTAGDTLAIIARKFNVTPQSVLDMNQVTNPDLLAPGQELKIPGDPPEGYGGVASYTVKEGDTLATIAAERGTTIPELQKLNNLSNTDLLIVGQVLKVPGVAVIALPTSAPAAQPAQAGGNDTLGPGGTYVVKAGDTFAIIAGRFGVSAVELQRINNITDVEKIYVGQTLKLPGGAPAASGSSGAKTYVVQRGDTLYSIAVRFGVTVAALQAANNIANPNQVVSGQTLRIP